MIGFSLKNSDCICFSTPASAAFSGEALVPWWLKGSEEHAGQNSQDLLVPAEMKNGQTVIPP